MGKEKTLPILALILLLIGSTSSLYVYATTTNTTTIQIKNTDYTIDQLFLIAPEKTITVNDETFSGVALDAIIKNIGIINPEQQKYTIIGVDNYQKTVTWENLQNGIITRERSSIFSDLPKAFRVKDIIVIEVNI